MNTVGYVHTVKVYFWMVGNLVRSSALLFSSRKLPAAHHTHSTAATLLREGNDRRCVWKPLVGKKMQAGDKQTLWFSVWMMRLLHPWSLILQITCAFLPCWIPVIIFRHLFITIYKVMFKSVVCVCGWGGGGVKKKAILDTAFDIYQIWYHTWVLQSSLLGSLGVPLRPEIRLLWPWQALLLLSHDASIAPSICLLPGPKTICCKLCYSLFRLICSLQTWCDWLSIHSTVLELPASWPQTPVVTASIQDRRSDMAWVCVLERISSLCCLIFPPLLLRVPLLCRHII